MLSANQTQADYLITNRADTADLMFFFAAAAFLHEIPTLLLAKDNVEVNQLIDMLEVEFLPDKFMCQYVKFYKPSNCS